MPTATSTRTSVGSTSRDKYVWPCAATSIWNQPIGSGAVYVSAGLQPATAWYGKITQDVEIINLDPSQPLKTLNGGPQVRVRPDQSWSGGWNGVAAFLNADGSRVEQGQPLLLAQGGNPSWQYNYGAVDIKGDCISGAHGGSGLSSFGGSLREGELDGVIHHALKINVYAKRFLSCASGGFRWPASRADSYMNCTTYGGTVPQMRMGALVALRPSENCAAYGEAQARSVCHALQDYGAYIADDTFWSVHSIDGPVDIEALPQSFHDQVMGMFTKLAVIDNNTPASIGGGGAPRAPIAPPFSN